MNKLDFEFALYIAFYILILDFIWINIFLLPIFSSMIDKVQKEPIQLNLIGAVVAYFVLILFAFLFLPKMNNEYEAFMLGFLLYAVYDSTNYATLKNWNAYVAIVDSLWGGVLFYLLYIFTLKTSA